MHRKMDNKVPDRQMIQMSTF